jgi:branched-chain amino acid transport system substrate-binding protein
MRAARIGLVAVLSIAVSTVAACGKEEEAATGGGGENASGGTLKVGAALALTGALAREGGLTRQGYEICQDTVNAKGGIKAGDATYKLEIVYRDDTSNPDTAAQLVDRFNDEGVKFIFGPYGSASTEAASAVIERNQQVMIDTAGADDKIFSKGYTRTFGVLSPATQYIASMVKALAEMADPKPKTIAFLTADDGFSKTAAEGGQAEAKRQGMEVVAVESFPEKTTDVSSALTKVKPLDPDVIIGSVHIEEGVAIIKQSRELDVKPDGFGETVAPPTPDFVKTLGSSADGVLGSTQWVPQVTGSDKYFGTAKDYAAAFEKKYGQAPFYHNAEASAGCLTLALAIEKAGSTEPDAVRDAVAGLNVESFFGPISFDETGKNAKKPMSVIQIQDGKVVTVWPADQAEKPMQWPGTT